MIALGVKTGLDEKSISENCRKNFGFTNVVKIPIKYSHKVINLT